MKLAEALVLRADLQKRVELLRSRLVESAKVQEGEKPPEEPGMLFRELDQAISQLGRLIPQINRLNLQTQLPDDGRTLTEALTQRDMLTLRQSVLKSVLEGASTKADRYSRTEIRYQATVEVAQLRQEYDSLAVQRRELDTLIQATNWMTDFVAA